jgi:hypothetical protein
VHGPGEVGLVLRPGDRGEPVGEVGLLPGSERADDLLGGLLDAEGVRLGHGQRVHVGDERVRGQYWPGQPVAAGLLPVDQALQVSKSGA